MSAIQEIQTLLSQGQPIPESVQLNALSEASSLGLSNAELGAILGVPESIISDAAANLGFGRMGIRPPTIPEPIANPLAGIVPAPVNYARQVKTLIEQQQPIPVELQKQTFQQAVEQGVSREQMGEFLGVAPEMISQAATDLGIADQLPPVLMGTENPAIQNINNLAAQEIIKSIPPTGTYTPEQVETVTDLINTGQVNISDVSSHFNVDPSFVMEVVSGVPKSVYAEGSFTPEQVNKLESMISSGVATSDQVAQYFDAPVSDVTNYLAQNANYTPDQLASSFVSNIAADQDYTMEEAMQVKAAIDSGNMTVAQAARQFGVPEADVIRVMGEIDAANATNTTDLTYGRDGDNIPTGLTGAETALTGSASDALNLLNQINQAGRADLIGMTNRGLDELIGSYQQSRSDITEGTTSGLDALNAGMAQARTDLTGGTTNALNALQTGATQARGDITNAFGRAEAMFDPYAQAGTTALQQQLALSGALGQDAFNQAYQESPQMAFLREQGMRANLSGAAATGGLGGGNVQRELQRFGQGLASQGLQQQIENLGVLSGQGFNAASNASNVATTGGTNLANIASQLGANQSNLYQNQGQNLSAIAQQQGLTGMDAYLNQGTNLARLAEGYGVNQLNTRTNLGSQLANYGLNTGLPAASTVSNLGINLASGRTQAGRDLANQVGSVAQLLGGIQQGQATNLANLTQGQMNYINSLTNNAATAEAQAQQGYSGNQANLLTGTGSAMVGLSNVPSFVPDYGNQVGNAAEAAAAGYSLFGNQNTNQNSNSRPYTGPTTGGWGGFFSNPSNSYSPQYPQAAMNYNPTLYSQQNLKVLA
jgi:hypothetical protein